MKPWDALRTAWQLHFTVAVMAGDTSGELRYTTMSLSASGDGGRAGGIDPVAAGRATIDTGLREVRDRSVWSHEVGSSAQLISLW